MTVRTAQLAVPDDVRMTAGACLYTIRVDGHLGAYVLSAFPGLAAEHEATGTVLTGVLDQAALYGVLAYLEMLGVDLLEVRRVAEADESPAGG
jgi:hypothetical protein